MTQRPLALWASDDYTTYTELDARRTEEFNRRGPGLLRSLRQQIETYEDTCDSVCIGPINDLAVNLSALSPAWMDFSVEVLRVMLNPAQNSSKHLRSEFESTIKRQAKAA